MMVRYVYHLTHCLLFSVANFGMPSRWWLVCCPLQRATVSHALCFLEYRLGAPVADQILKHDSLDIAPIMGPLGSVPTIDVGHPNVLYRDPNRLAEFRGLCRTRDAPCVYLRLSLSTLGS